MLALVCPRQSASFHAWLFLSSSNGRTYALISEYIIPNAGLVLMSDYSVHNLAKSTVTSLFFHTNVSKYPDQPNSSGFYKAVEYLLAFQN